MLSERPDEERRGYPRQRVLVRDMGAPMQCFAADCGQYDVTAKINWHQCPRKMQLIPDLTDKFVGLLAGKSWHRVLARTFQPVVIASLSRTERVTESRYTGPGCGKPPRPTATSAPPAPRRDKRKHERRDLLIVAHPVVDVD